MSEPKFTEFENFQNNSGNSENSGQICTRVVRDHPTSVFPGGWVVEKNKREKEKYTMKTIRFLLAAGLMLALAFIFSCSSDGSVGSSKSNTDITIDKRAVGTWENANGDTYVFKPDGTVKVGYSDFKYAFFSNKIVITRIVGYGKIVDVSDYAFSADGKTFIVYGSRTEWFTKKDDSKP
jgi:hypothetical protein